MALPKYEIGRLREAVAVFDDEASLAAAIDDLEEHGFDRAEISLLAGEDAVEKKLGHALKRVEDAEDDPDVPRTAYVSKESLGDFEGLAIGALLYIGAVGAAGAVVATGGALGALLFGTAAFGAAGATIGGFLAAWIGEHHATYIQDQLNRGGLVLWVRAWDPERETAAVDILSRHSAHDVHVHELKPRRQ